MVIADDREEHVVAIDQRALASTLQTLLATLDVPVEIDERALVERLDRVMDAAQQVLQVDGIGLLLLDRTERLRLIGASDPAGAALERGQQELSLGPAIDCVCGNRTVSITDLAARDDYAPLWQWLEQHLGTAGEAAPVRAVASVPVCVAGRVVGTLNVLRNEPWQWTVEDTAAVEAYANVIGVLLRLAAPQSDGRIRMSETVEDQ